MKNFLIGLGALAMGAFLIAGDAAARGGGGGGDRGGGADRGGMGGAAIDRGADTGIAGAAAAGAVGTGRTRSRCQMVPVRQGTQTVMMRRC